MVADIPYFAGPAGFGSSGDVGSYVDMDRACRTYSRPCSGIFPGTADIYCSVVVVQEEPVALVVHGRAPKLLFAVDVTIPAKLNSGGTIGFDLDLAESRCVALLAYVKN